MLNFFYLNRSKICLILVVSLVCFSCANNTSNYEKSSISDPLENYNRKIHKFNKFVDKAAVKPISELYGNSIPQSFRLSGANFYGNLQEPKRLTNHLIQGEYGKASIDLSRFLINSTVGLLGLFDLASWIPFLPEETSFDETFSYFSIPNGPYLEVPLIGPSSFRGALGLLADNTVNPLVLLPGVASSVSFVALEVANIVNKRYEYSETVDTLLYQSSDSYSSSRLGYIQKTERRKIAANEIHIELFDPSEDF